MENTKLQKIWENLKSYWTMDKNYIKFDDSEIEEYKCYQHKRPMSINDIDIVVIDIEIVVSNNEIEIYSAKKILKEKLFSWF